MRAKYRADFIIKTVQTRSSDLGKMYAAVHEGCLEEQRLMKQSHAVRMKARIVGITKAAESSAVVSEECLL